MNYFLKFIFGIKVYMFRTVPLSIIRSFSLYTQQWYLIICVSMSSWFYYENTPSSYHLMMYTKIMSVSS